MFQIPTDPATHAVYQHVLRLFAQTGQLPTVEALASAAKLPDIATANNYLNQMADIGCLVRDPESGQILSAYPFSSVPTAHRITPEDNPEVYAMCAIDALGTSFMFDLDAVIQSSCQHCKKEITIHISDGSLSLAVPDEIVVVYAIASANCCAATDQCPYINFFCSVEHAQTWQTSQPHLNSKVMSLAHAVDAGRVTFGNVLCLLEDNIHHEKE